MLDLQVNKSTNLVDPFSETKPNPRVSQQKPNTAFSPGSKFNARFKNIGWFVLALSVSLVVVLITAYLFIPGRTNVLIIGVDDRQEGGSLGRTDTMILTTFVSPRGYLGMLSIPRDLWVLIPNVGENRINTAHFFAEANAPGTGSKAAQEVVSSNFGVDVDYVVRLRFDSIKDLVQNLGGIEVKLDEPMGGYTAGKHILDGDQALAFVRDRQGSDDFSRMVHGQIFLQAVFRSLLSPKNLTQFPSLAQQLIEFTDSDVPFYLWPRLGVVLLQSLTIEMDTRTITREMVFPFTTSEGAQVLAPNWEKINPVLMEMFDQ